MCPKNYPYPYDTFKDNKKNFKFKYRYDIVEARNKCCENIPTAKKNIDLNGAGDGELEDDYDEEKVMDMAISAGADDVIIEANVFSVITAHDQLNSVANNLSNAGANIDSQKLIYTPKTTASIEDSSIAKQVLKLFTVLDDYDDSQSVFGNFDISNQLMEEIEL